MRQQILDLLNRRHKALSRNDILRFLELDESSGDEFDRTLSELVEGGYVRQTKKERFELLSESGCHVGTIQVHERGFGFFIFEDGSQPDVFIPAPLINGAMNEDKVLVCLTKPFNDYGKAEGRVARVLERNTQHVVGKLDLGKRFAFVIPREKKVKQDIFVPLDQLGGARHGEIVDVEITAYPKGRNNPEGKVVEVIGQSDDSGIAIETVIHSLGLPKEFPPEVLAQAEAIPEKIPAEEIRRRNDRRSDLIVTIDGADAQDFDDAITVFKKGPNYELSVHIADVTHYVAENSPIDQEALERGTSVYFPGRVIPMLPEKLSNNMCSLRPDEDRLCLSVDMSVSPEGKVVDHRIYESIIRSSERLIYDDVSDYLEGDSSKFSGDLATMLSQANELAGILRQKRFDRGAINFGFMESEIIVDEEGYPIDVRKRESRVANQMIEEFMILANETVSEHFFHLDLPFLYRTHEKPSLEKLTDFNNFIHNFGLGIRGKLEDVRPQQLNAIIEEVVDQPHSSIISKLMLRSLKQAKYTNYMEGHFGLASKYYSHFTSPIRRYPDLQIHRIIKENLSGKLSQGRVKHYETILPEVAELSSKRERRADSAEREVDDIKMAEFMQDKIGQTYLATVSGVTGFGLFVELDNSVEGMVRISDISWEDFQFDPDKYLIKGIKNGKTLTVGDKVPVQLIRVNVEAGEITFELLEKLDEATGK
ncbi:MAG TPA: ribonuclease R [Tissierellia bacterium]|nr:ribonuclease R [Tissierellia bacterium]